MPLDLRLLFGGPFPQVGDLGGAAFLVGAEAARIPGQLPGGDLGDPGHHRIQEESVVRHEHQPSPVPGEEVQQPGPRFDIEVVRRLVEQDQVVGFEEEPRQGDAHLPALGEVPDRSIAVPPGEPEPRKHLADPGVEFVAAAPAPLFFQFAVSVQEPGLARRLRQPFRQSLLGSPLRQQVGEGALHFVGDGALAEPQPLLRQVADAAGPRPDDFALVGAGQAGQDLQQGGLAGAVGADQSDPLAGADAPVDPVEQHLLAVGLRGFDQLDHRARLLSARRPPAREVREAGPLGAPRPGGG